MQMESQHDQLASHSLCTKEGKAMRAGAQTLDVVTEYREKNHSHTFKPSAQTDFTIYSSFLSMDFYI